MAPNATLESSPELIVTTGMPALTAFCTDVCSACGFAIETTSPPTLWATALSISLAWETGSPSE